jgi:hypothetical protein
MADNTVINPITLGGGDTLSTDELTTLNGVASSGVKIQRIKICFGNDADARDASLTYPVPVKQPVSDKMVTVTAAVNTQAVLTLPAPAAGLFIHITDLEIVKLYNVIGIADGAGVIVTSTNLPGTPAWTTEQMASAAGTVAKVVKLTPMTPLKASVAATQVTVTAPAQLQTIWRINATYFEAP